MTKESADEGESLALLSPAPAKLVTWDAKAHTGKARGKYLNLLHVCLPTGKIV